MDRPAWRGGGRDQPTAQQLKQHQQEYEQALVIDGSDGSDCWPLEFWPLGSRALSPASYGSSSDCLADALVSTLQRYCSDGCCGDALDAAVECVPWPPLAGGDSSASQAPLPAQQQQQSHELQSGGSHSGSGTTVGTSVDWQQLLESWAVPCSAPAVVPPPLEALLAEEDAPPLPQPGQAPPAPQQQRRQSPRSRRVASAPAAQSARTFRTRQSTAGNAPALQPRPTAPARASSATAAPASSAAASPASAAAHSSPPSQQQPSLNMQAHPVLRPLVVLAQQPGPRKRGRPRVYDTITPVLEAATLEQQPSAGLSSGEEPPRKRRGAKPKYICATQEEAIAKRRDRNRETALATYYRRKARIVELRGVVAALEAENAALDTLAYAAEGSEDCAGYIRPLLEGGCEPTMIVALLLPDEDSS